ncbi:HNH endonuclease [Mesorhizobium sp. M0496]|uniref:HNH endonuclease n=1 Tax=unclassified Mesorhizobium TaxID=325217 RepID=UPI003335A801
MWDRNATEFSERHNIPAGLAKRFQCTAEHLNPRMNGGQDRLDNLVAACKFCNQTRHRMDEPLPWLEYLQHVRKRTAAGKWHPLVCYIGIVASHRLSNADRSLQYERSIATSGSPRCWKSRKIDASAIVCSRRSTMPSRPAISKASA